MLLSQAQNTSTNQNSRIQQIPGSSLSFKMQSIPAGSFIIGSPASEKNREKSEGPQKKMQIPAFWMGAYEVTRDEFDVFLKDEQTSQNVDLDAITRPSAQYVDLTWGMGKEGGYPANSMSQFGALMYCKWLYQKTGIFLDYLLKQNGNMLAEQVPILPIIMEMIQNSCINMLGI